MSFREHRFGPEHDLILSEGSMKERAELLQTLEPGECYKVSYSVSGGTDLMQRYVDGLCKAGLDIGKGDAIFGYQMPLPKKKATYRDLIIFRRK